MGVTLIAAACDPAPGSMPVTVDPSGGTGPRLTVPAIPLPAASSWTVSADALAKVPCTRCAVDPQHPDSPRFFYGDLPLGTVDALMSGHWADGSPVDVRQALGNMFVSGYFGGIYLRGSLGSAGVDASSIPMKTLLDTLGSGVQSVFDALATSLVHTATAGTDAEVRSASTGWSVGFAAVHGYNRGYLDVALANPPSGLASATGSLTCASQFDCRSASLPLGALDTLAPTLSHLSHPDSLEWLAAGQGLPTIANATSASGHDVWTHLLAGAAFDANAYRAIIDFSVGFLEINQAALLADVEGAIGNVAIGRRGLQISAALLVWAGSYFMGLASSLPNDRLPSITCPT